MLLPRHCSRRKRYLIAWASRRRGHTSVIIVLYSRGLTANSFALIGDSIISECAWFVLFNYCLGGQHAFWEYLGALRLRTPGWLRDRRCPLRGRERGGAEARAGSGAH